MYIKLGLTQLCFQHKAFDIPFPISFLHYNSFFGHDSFIKMLIKSHTFVEILCILSFIRFIIIFILNRFIYLLIAREGAWSVL